VKSLFSFALLARRPFVRNDDRADGTSDRLETVLGNGMPDIKIVTEVAGRICALPVEAGGNVGDGDDIAFVEAMKMEIPVASPAAGRLKSILVRLDDVVAEGQVVAILET
jgi:biotin carboxyl carrier protein